MPRLPRIVVPGFPHHVTQRGVRSLDVFHCDDDRRGYLSFLAEESDRFGLDTLVWCLMVDHVHFIAVPREETSLAKAFGEAAEGGMTKIPPTYSRECFVTESMR